jgi:hypothetical protein
LLQVGSEPVIQAVLDVLYATTIACGSEFVTAAGLSGFVAGIGPAKRMGLAMGVTLRLVELLAEALEFVFQFGDAAIALLTAGTGRTSESHEVFPEIG